MNNPELEMLAKINNQIGKLEGAQEASTKAIGDMASNINRLIEKMDKSDDIAREADQRARSAHHRIDEANKRMDKIDKKVEEEAEKAKAGRRWLTGMAVSVISLGISVIGLILKIK